MTSVWGVCGELAEEHTGERGKNAAADFDSEHESVSSQQLASYSRSRSKTALAYMKPFLLQR